MKRFVKLAAWVASAALALAATAPAIVFALNFRAQRRAEAFLREARTLRLRASTIRDLGPTVERYDRGPGGLSDLCPSADRSYSVRVASDTVNLLLLRFPILQRISIRPWQVALVILLQGETVCYVGYSISIWAAAGDGEIAALARLAPGEYALLPDNSQYDVRLNLVRNHIHMLDVTVTPEATVEQHRHSFDFDLSCVTRFGGCRAVCELMPSAWLDYQREARAKGWSLPPEEANDPLCKKLGSAD